MSQVNSVVFSLAEKRSTTVYNKPLVMAVLNVTPDSFSDGGRFSEPNNAYDQAMKMLDAGASIIDVGGESTRPGAEKVSEQEELQRVVPVIEKIAAATDALISIDTSKAEVMKEAHKAGAGMLNDVRSFSATDALKVASESGLPVCIMHMRGQPATMQDEVSYRDNVVREVFEYLKDRINACVAAGVERDRIIADPGFGFGKTLQHNLQLFANLEVFKQLGVPILIGVSRKSMFKELLGREVDQRLAGGLALATLAADAGVSIIRTHDVASTCDAIEVVHALRRCAD